MSSDDLKLITIRRMVEGDTAYIYSSWLEDYLSSHHLKQRNTDRTLQSYVALMPRELYYKEQRARIDKILKKSIVYVACNSEDEEQIFGYIVFRTVGALDILSWIYVRPVYRGFCIADKLMKKMGEADVITHVTPMRRWFLKRYNLIYNPFMEEIDNGN